MAGTTGRSTGWVWLVLLAGLLSPVAVAVTVPWSVAFADDGGDGDGGDGDGGDDGGGDDDGDDGGGPGGGPGGFEPGGGRWLPWQTPGRPAAPRPAPRAPATFDGIVIGGLDEDDVAALRRDGYRVRAERRSRLLGGVSVRVLPPRRVSTERALRDLKRRFPGKVVDRNRLYQTFRVQGEIRRPASGAEPANPVRDLIGWPAEGCRAERVTIGLVDTGIDTAHPALKSARLETVTVRADGRAASGRDHGTAVALLLAGEQGAFAGLTPEARILAADAFHRRDGRDVADAFDLVAALETLADRGARVINLSLAGDANELLDTAGKALAERGVLVVAAAGNDGPSAPPRYPAAYPWALAVTAVDERSRVYPRAVRGPHIAYAAPGVRLPIPEVRAGRVRVVTGTSFAAPLVAAAAAGFGASAKSFDPDKVRAALTGAVADLGAPGRDPVFGLGALAFGGRCPVGEKEPT